MHILLRKLAFATAFLWSVSLAQTAATDFEGSVYYSITVTGKYATDFLANNPPKNMDMHIHKGNFLINLTGGQTPKTMLFVNDSSETYILDVPNQRVFKNEYYFDTTKVKPAVLTADSGMVLGVKCKVYKLIKPGQTIYYYVSDAYKVDLKPYAGKKDAKANYLTPGLEGRIPLKTVIKESGLVTTMVCTKITPRALEDSQFKFPTGWEIKKRDHRF